ncbi:IS66 family insertion sequence element accessory protein TnpB [Paenibacillus sp. 19GGS1-52]|uniref:IS66 family insertion sequence element accessory protein TnpA n=1 Tax=Paenibacillus sp. 19GGS1-52 TaxID=2758563 RepID=UPI001EFBECEA|nr:IS66 family insertion sequence element accessory protein TnpB [Paenibacillus sp. 19GGS1-52]ULO09523.1 IS66 family insertion sequence element accessory protein TnpB [Paenibacillus sp. 19GGS1-52]
MTKAQQRQKEWTERIANYRTSGQTMSVWCHSHGVTPHQLKYWLRKLDPVTPRTSAPRFIPVTLTPQSPVASLTLRIGPASIDMQEGFSPELLRQIVRALENLC